MTGPAASIREVTGVTVPDAEEEARAAELVTRHCGTASPGVLELLDIIGIGFGGEREPRSWDSSANRAVPDSFRRGRKGRRR